MLEKISYRQWNNAYRIFNDTVELIVLADVGPRVIRYASIDGDNVLHEVAQDAGLIGGGQFRLYGGHRLWVWPEIDRTYFPDNRPVSVFQNGVSTRFTAPVEDSLPGIKLQKEFEVALDDVGSHVTITHLVTN